MYRMKILSTAWCGMMGWCNERIRIEWHIYIYTNKVTKCPKVKSKMLLKCFFVNVWWPGVSSSSKMYNLFALLKMISSMCRSLIFAFFSLLLWNACTRPKHLTKVWMNKYLFIHICIAHRVAVAHKSCETYDLPECPTTSTKKKREEKQKSRWQKQLKAKQINDNAPPPPPSPSHQQWQEKNYVQKNMIENFCLWQC